MERLKLAIHATFPGFDILTFSPDLKLGAIEDWDSMSAINFAVELERVFEVPVGSQTFQSDQTVADVMAILIANGAVL